MDTDFREGAREAGSARWRSPLREGGGRGEVDCIVAARGAASRNDKLVRAKESARVGVVRRGGELFGVGGGEGGGGFWRLVRSSAGRGLRRRRPSSRDRLGFGEGAEAEAEFEGAAGEVAHLLAFMPFAFADAFGDGGGETDDDAVVARAAHDAEGVGENFSRGEIGGAFERGLGGGDVGDAREGEGAEGGALEVEGDEIPEVFAVGQVVGADAAGGFFRVAGFAVGEGDFPRAEDGGAEGVEDGEVGFADADVFEGDGAKFVGGGEGNFVAEAAGEFFEGDLKLAVKRGAAVLLEGALGDEEGEEFAFGDVDGGKGVDGVGVAVGLDAGVEFDGEFEAVAHEGEVADDGFAGDFEGADEVRAVDEGAAAELVVDAHHAFGAGGRSWGKAENERAGKWKGGNGERQRRRGGIFLNVESWKTGNGGKRNEGRGRAI